MTGGKRWLKYVHLLVINARQLMNISYRSGPIEVRILHPSTQSLPYPVGKTRVEAVSAGFPAK